MRLINLVLWLIGATLGVRFIVELGHEQELRAPRRVAAFVLPLLGLWALVIALGAVPVLAAVAVVAALPFFYVGVAVYRGWRGALPAGSVGLGHRDERVDERDTMFARMAYTPGGAAYEDYYTRHPERQQTDDMLRALPQLCGEGSLTYDKVNSRVAPAIFELLEQWHPLVHFNSPAEPVPTGDNPGPALARRVKALARYYGALDAGVVELDPAYIYTHVGRREAEYGREVALGHTYGVVFTVEMDYRYIRSAPSLPVVVESSHQYLEAAKVALALAANIEAMGWEARAHMDANYLAVLPPLAVRAGLGEIGRMGLLVTESHGPRVRLGLVTTSMPLEPDNPRPFGLQQFCTNCKKCATACPPRVISMEDKAPAEGWKIEWERCYKFWRISGTDCATCLSSCPYSKPQSPFHNLTRLAMRHSEPLRRLALVADDWVYGKRHFDEWEPGWFNDR